MASISAGLQTIQIIFDNPQSLRSLHLVVVEEREARTQEFVLRWAREQDGPFEEIVRQQYHFVPPGSEVEDWWSARAPHCASD